MSQARNDREVLNMLRFPLRKAVGYVVDKIYDENIGAIHDVVYMAYSPKKYNRTGDFYTAWGSEFKSLSPDTIRGTFKYDGSKMSTGSTDAQLPNYAQHVGVSGDYYGSDARPYLAELIYGGMTGSYFGDGAFRKKRDAWKELNRRIGKRKLKQWMKEGLEYAGLTVQAHNVPINVTVTKED